MGDDGQLGAEALDMLGLLAEVGLGDEEREVGVAGARLFDAGIHLGLDALPDGVAPRADDHGPPHRAVVGQLGLGHHVLIPAGEVGGLRREDGGFRHGARL